MIGRELEDKLNYIGMERKLRKLALEKKLETAEKIAVMTTTEVCDLVLKEYEVVYAESEEIGLVEKDKMKEYNSLVETIFVNGGGRMNVLEKILEEIEEATFQEDAPIYIGDMEVDGYVRASRVEEIIRSHMGGATDTDDTEEKIREHIEECLHRIDNIRSFIGSKEYTSNDEKCIRNIEVLKTSITALEEYLSSKKKNGNNGWIPVEERLPEDCEEIVLVQVSGKMAENIWFDNAFELATYVNGEGWILENYPECENPKVIAWQPLPEPYRPKEKNNE